MAAAESHRQECNIR